jgi:hypothetical protein
MSRRATGSCAEGRQPEHRSASIPQDLPAPATQRVSCGRRAAGERGSHERRAGERALHRRALQPRQCERYATERYFYRSDGSARSYCRKCREPYRHRSDPDQTARPPQDRDPDRRWRCAAFLGRHADTAPAGAGPRAAVAHDAHIQRIGRDRLRKTFASASYLARTGLRSSERASRKSERRRERSTAYSVIAVAGNATRTK